MIFITEDDLRYKYRKEPFTTYEPEPNTRLTPGARQFLVDKGINMYENETKVMPVIKDSLTKEICCPTANPDHNGLTQGEAESNEMEIGTVTANPAIKQAKSGKKANWRMLMIRRKLDSVQAVFLETIQVLLENDIASAQHVVTLNRQFDNIIQMVAGNGVAPNLALNGYTGNELQCEDDLGGEIKITEFHVQLGNGKQILALHKLRCALREVEPVVLQAFDGYEQGQSLGDDLIEKINQIVYSVSKTISSVIGGKECQM